MIKTGIYSNSHLILFDRSNYVLNKINDGFMSLKLNTFCDNTYKVYEKLTKSLLFTHVRTFHFIFFEDDETLITPKTDIQIPEL